MRRARQTISSRVNETRRPQSDWIEAPTVIVDTTEPLHVLQQMGVVPGCSPPCGPNKGGYMTIRRTLMVLLCLLPASLLARALPDFTQLVETYSPAVVNVSTVRGSGASGERGEELEEFFRRFFPPERGGPGDEGRAQGSGFIITSDGYVLTNNHVIANAETIYIRLNDRRELEATLVGADPRSDLAVLKIDGTDLPTVKLGRSENLRVGEWVLAIGSPFGFEYSVTAGIVSAKGRSLPRERENYVPFIQTDVAINPGNSGGPLFNLDGEVVGINSQIYTRSGGFMGVSFAIPIDVAMEVADQLRETGEVSRGWLGVVIETVDRNLAERYNLEKAAGALVSQVQENSPAEAAGLRAGDIITGFNGRSIDLSSDLPHMVGRVRAGSEADVLVVRDGETQVIKVEIGELARPERRVARERRSDRADPDRLGLVVQPIPERIQERSGTNIGVWVVSASGPAAEAGVRERDIITRLNNRELDSVETYNEMVAGLNAGRSVPVLIVRGETPTFLALRVPDH